MSKFDQRNQHVQNQTNIGSLTIPLPPWLFWTITAALLILVATTLFTFANQNRTQIDYWLHPIQPEQPDEILILIATFDISENVIDTRLQNEISRAIHEEAANFDLSNLRIEVESMSISSDNRSTAETLGQRYNASVIIWGEDTGARVTVNYLVLKEIASEVTDVSITETERTQIANPSAYGQFITADLPTQLTFLALFTVGQSLYINGDRRSWNWKQTLWPC